MKKGEYFNPWREFVGAFIPNWLMMREEVSPGAKLVYARLAQFSGKECRCNPRQEVLCEACGMKERSLRNYISELEAYELIDVERIGLQKPNQYHFRRHEWQIGFLSLDPDPDRQKTTDQDRQSVATLDQQNLAAPYIDEENHIKREGATPFVLSAETPRKHSKSDLFVELIPKDFLNNSQFCGAWKGFVDMRIAKKSPLTERAVKLILAKLAKIGDIESVIATLDQSTLNNWTDVYAPKTAKLGPQVGKTVPSAKLQTPMRYMEFIMGHPNRGVREAYATWDRSAIFDPDGIRKAYYRWEKTGTY